MLFPQLAEITDPGVLTQILKDFGLAAAVVIVVKDFLAFNKARDSHMLKLAEAISQASLVINALQVTVNALSADMRAMRDKSFEPGPPPHQPRPKNNHERGG